jgi:hypothetical protein
MSPNFSASSTRRGRPPFGTLTWPSQSERSTVSRRAARSTSCQSSATIFPTARFPLFADRDLSNNKIIGYVMFKPPREAFRGAVEAETGVEAASKLKWVASASGR